MKTKNYPQTEEKVSEVKDPVMAYQRSKSDSGVTRMMSRKELDAECFSLEESRTRLVEKIHHHFHSNV